MIPALRMRSSRLLARSARSTLPRNIHAGAATVVPKLLSNSTGVSAPLGANYQTVQYRWLSSNEAEKKEEEDSSSSSDDEGKTEPAKKTNAEKLEFQAETKQLLDIVTNSLYTDKDVVSTVVLGICNSP